MSDSEIVQVAQGSLRGKKVTTNAGVTYYSFQGIPYAKPPVGPLRFEAPQPAEPWNGIRDALQLGPSAPQVERMFYNKYLGEEDCLFLNVYTPQTGSGTKKRAVMVFIHGGAFNMGSGNDDIYQPNHLITRDVVFVTINYRLGTLGFIYTGDSEMSGNNGLKDQVMALRWVQENIEQFGGDPGNVTIFGESAGGVSVHCHVLSPMSKGLFHKAIAQSGCVLNPWACELNPREKAFRLGEALGCKTCDSKLLIDYLRKLPAQELIEGVDKALTPEEKTSFKLYYAPCVETASPGNEIFLPEHPYQLVKEGKFHKVPFMTGFTSHEGMLMLRGLYEKPELFEMLGKDEESVIPYKRRLNKGSEESKEVARKFKKFYYGDKPVGKDSIPELIDVLSDAYFIHGIMKTAEIQALQTDTPVYLYQFSFDENLGVAEKFLGGPKHPGVCHAGELPYLFKGSYIEDKFLASDTEHMKVVNLMVNLWTNFAKTGNPTSDDEDIGVKWEPVEQSKLACLDINLIPSLRTDIMADRYAFWNEIITQL